MDTHSSEFSQAVVLNKYQLSTLEFFNLKYICFSFAIVKKISTGLKVCDAWAIKYNWHVLSKISLENKIKTIMRTNRKRTCRTGLLSHQAFLFYSLLVPKSLSFFLLCWLLRAGQISSSSQHTLQHPTARTLFLFIIPKWACTFFWGGGGGGGGRGWKRGRRGVGGEGRFMGRQIITTQIHIPQSKSACYLP